MAKRSLAIFNTDQVNRAKLCVPASALMKAEESHIAYAKKQGLPRGLPVNFQHDMHRLVGWSSTLGHFIDGSMVRVVGIIEEPETETEWSQLRGIRERFWEYHHAAETALLRTELAQRVIPELLDVANTVFLRIETCVAARKNLAANLYPELFAVSSEYVDKDGLTDYRYLIQRLKVIGPGIFLDEGRQLVLFAHRFFRRSLSHRNKLNEYFINSFSNAAKNQKVRLRLRLDPDLVGHPGDVKELLEFEYWHGPRYSDDISSIPSGVAVHKASERTREFEGVDKTQVWWKSPETRSSGDGAKNFRTLEIEELMEFPAAGLPGDRYGCRYAHAEYSMDDKFITHFDGAIRAYPAESYLERIDLNIDHAGKHSEYTKLFRFDGELAINSWKRLLSDYFRGNPLIPEYLDASPEQLKDEGADDKAVEPSLAGSVAEVPADPVHASEEALCAFIHLRPGHLLRDLDLALKHIGLPDGKHTVPVMETGVGAIDKMLRARLPLASVASIRVPDERLELVGLLFGSSEGFPGTMYVQVHDLAEALSKDISELRIRSVALSLTWPHGDVLTTLSMRGPSEPLLSLLSRLFSIVDATKPASDWIETLSSAVKGLSPLSKRTGQLDGVLDGILSFGRGEAEGEVMFPPELSKELIEKGHLDHLGIEDGNR
ncbi:MAG: hypothetical protein U1C47_03175 [Hydrogenophaga sp.]|nr:hypothetical protein [Hydrogenophaga sp.]